jgi:hypothetical protein
MIVGVTGTRNGATREQLFRLHCILSEVKVKNGFHHGDCIGVDAQAHDIATNLGYQTIIHPPKSNVFRAFKRGEIILPEKGYLARNIDIVDNSNYIISLPKGTDEELRGSGTWHVIRLARKLGKKLTIIWPDGALRVCLKQIIQNLIVADFMKLVDTNMSN